MPRAHASEAASRCALDAHRRMRAAKSRKLAASRVLADTTYLFFPPVTSRRRKKGLGPADHISRPIGAGNGSDAAYL